MPTDLLSEITANRHMHVFAVNSRPGLRTSKLPNIDANPSTRGFASMLGNYIYTIPFTLDDDDYEHVSDVII